VQVRAEDETKPAKVNNAAIALRFIQSKPRRPCAKEQEGAVFENFFLSN